MPRSPTICTSHMHIMSSQASTVLVVWINQTCRQARYLTSYILKTSHHSWSNLTSMWWYRGMLSANIVLESPIQSNGDIGHLFFSSPFRFSQIAWLLGSHHFRRPFNTSRLSRPYWHKSPLYISSMSAVHLPKRDSRRANVIRPVLQIAKTNIAIRDSWQVYPIISKQTFAPNTESLPHPHGHTVTRREPPTQLGVSQ